MTIREVDQLLTHQEWADAAVWVAVLKLGGGSRLDDRLFERLHHLHTVQQVYLNVWRGEPARPPEAASFSDMTSVARWAKDGHASLRAFARGLSDDSTPRPVVMPWSAEIAKRFGSAAPVTLSETILQVVLHSTYHRGQVATRLREIGGEPPLTDFIAWLWLGSPEPEWPPEG